MTAPAPRNHPAESEPLTIRHRRIVSATVFVAYDDGTTEIHSVARGGKNTKLTIDLSEDA